MGFHSVSFCASTKRETFESDRPTFLYISKQTIINLNAFNPSCHTFQTSIFNTVFFFFVSSFIEIKMLTLKRLAMVSNLKSNSHVLSESNYTDWFNGFVMFGRHDAFILCDCDKISAESCSNYKENSMELINWKLLFSFEFVR